MSRAVEIARPRQRRRRGELSATSSAWWETRREKRPHGQKCGFDVQDPRFAEVQALFERGEDEDTERARAILRRLVFEFGNRYALPGEECEESAA